MENKFTTRQEILNFALSLPMTYPDAPFHDDNWQLVRYKKNKKAFVWTFIWKEQLCMNVKVNPEWREVWQQTYPEIIPAYHMNKKYWITVILDGQIPDSEVTRLIQESYDLVK